MSKPKDFRIGNLVKYDGRIFEIDSISKEFPTLNTDEFGIGVVDWNNIEPTPLSEDVLVKLGFVNIERIDVFECFNYKYWVNNGVVLLYNESPPENTYKCGLAEMRCGKYHVALSRWINDVHSLQNIYHSLTNRELIYTP